MYRVMILAAVWFASAVSTPAHAVGLWIEICNRSDHPFQVALLRQYRDRGDLVWAVTGWTKFAPQRCGPLGRVETFWGALAFAAGKGEEFTPFKYTPNRENRRGPPPNVSQVCVTSDGSDFARRFLSNRELTSTCPAGEAAVIPISVFVEPGFSDSRVTFNVANVPATKSDVSQVESRFPKVSLTKWEPYIEQCIPDLVDRYARNESGALFECTCYAAATELSVSKQWHSYEYPNNISTAFERLPSSEQAGLTNLINTCRNRGVTQINEEFAALVDKLAPRFAPEPPEIEDPASVEMGTYMGMVANLNSKGPLILQSVEENSPAAEARLRPGDKITGFGPFRVKNLSELKQAIEEWRAKGETYVPLGVERSGAYYAIYLYL